MHFDKMRLCKNDQYYKRLPVMCINQYSAVTLLCFLAMDEFLFEYVRQWLSQLELGLGL